MVNREVRGLEGASDHAPAWIVLRDTLATHRKPARRSEKRTPSKSRISTHRAAPCPAKRCWSSTVIYSRIAPITLTRADADKAKVLTRDEARRVANNIGKQPSSLRHKAE